MKNKNFIIQAPRYCAAPLEPPPTSPSSGGRAGDHANCASCDGMGHQDGCADGQNTGGEKFRIKSEIKSARIISPTLSDLGQWVEHEYVQCSACSSLHPAEAIRLLRTDGTKFASDHWHEGWPHRFFIETGDGAPHGATYSFYTIHLNDASPAELREMRLLLKSVFGIPSWVTDDGKCFLDPLAAKKGTIWGEIVNGEPDFSAMNLVNGRKK